MPTTRTTRRKPHRPVLCPVSNKLRYRERGDAKQALREAWFARAHAAVNDRESSNRIVRLYKCADCSGFHTTSQP